MAPTISSPNDNNTRADTANYSTRSDISNYPKDNGASQVPNTIHIPEGNNNNELQSSAPLEPIVTNIINLTSYSNELTISSPILMSSSSNSPSITSHKPHVHLLVNDHPMLNRAKTDRSKPKAFVAHIEYEPTSAKQALTKP